MCTKEQVIDLEKEGYNPTFMDKFKPDIQISDWWDEYTWHADSFLVSSVVSCKKDLGTLFKSISNVH